MGEVAGFLREDGWGRRVVVKGGWVGEGAGFQGENISRIKYDQINSTEVATDKNLAINNYQHNHKQFEDGFCQQPAVHVLLRVRVWVEGKC